MVKKTMDFRPSSWPHWVWLPLLTSNHNRDPADQICSYLSPRGAHRLHIYPRLHLCDGQRIPGWRRHKCILLRWAPGLRVCSRRSMYSNDMGHDFRPLWEETNHPYRTCWYSIVEFGLRLREELLGRARGTRDWWLAQWECSRHADDGC